MAERHFVAPSVDQVLAQAVAHAADHHDLPADGWVMAPESGGPIGAGDLTTRHVYRQAFDRGRIEVTLHPDRQPAARLVVAVP